MIASSIAEVLSLAAVVPFLAVLSDTQTVWNHPLSQQWANQFGIATSEDLLLPITIVFGLGAILSGSLRLLTLWSTGRLSAAIGSDLSCEVFRRTLYQSYEVQVRRNSSILISSIGNDVPQVISLVMSPLLQLLSSSLIVIALISTLVLIDWFVALVASLLIGSVYALAVVISIRPLQELSRKQAFLNQQLVQALQEGLGAIRDVLLDGTQRFYVSNYMKADYPLRRCLAQAGFLSSYPRLVMEPAGIVLMAFLGYVLVINGNVARVMPLLGLLALGAQRLLPMAQKVYEGWAQAQRAQQSLVNVLELLNQVSSAQNINTSTRIMRFSTSIVLEDVRYRYGLEMPNVIDGVDLVIRKGERIGIIGSTGSGKSTLIDLLMGLLKPSEGTISVDGYDLHEKDLVSGWKAGIAHVPQSIYLADSSIAENIAFGISRNQVDMERVRRAAEQAQIAAYIEGLSTKYKTTVGERGIRLSGGQRQRLGIARALYKDAQVLVLDEATAALDTATEQAVMESVEGLSRELTVIIIAHRLSTIENCDRIIRLERGKIVEDAHPRDVFNKTHTIFDQ